VRSRPGQSEEVGYGDGNIDNRAQIDPRSVDELWCAPAAWTADGRILAIVISAWAAIVPYIGRPSVTPQRTVRGSGVSAFAARLGTRCDRHLHGLPSWPAPRKSAGQVQPAAAGSSCSSAGVGAIGPLSWTVIYAAPATSPPPHPSGVHLPVGSAIGPGLIMAAAGLSMGWASRHQRRVSTPPVPRGRERLPLQPGRSATQASTATESTRPARMRPPGPRVQMPPVRRAAPTTSGPAVYPSGAEPVVAAPPSAPAPRSSRPPTAAIHRRRSRRAAPAATAPQPPRSPPRRRPRGHQAGATPNRPSRPRWQRMAAGASPSAPTMARPEPGRAESGRDAAVEAQATPRRTRSRRSP